MFRKFEKAFWENVWDNIELPSAIEVKYVYDLHRTYLSYLPMGRNYKFVEIGCAPGRWLAYFKRYFGYEVNGLDYCPKAAELTRFNLSLLGVDDAEIYCEDFTKWDCPSCTFDITFSGGFIEHFENVAEIVSKIIAITKVGGYVITVVPNIYGLNGFIRKTFRSEEHYYGHTRIKLSTLVRLHERQNVATVFAGYGGLSIAPLLLEDRFVKKHPFISKAVNLPTMLRSISLMCTRYFGVTIRWQFLSELLIYIGEKRGE